VSRRTKRPAKPKGQNLAEWAKEYPEARVTRRELYMIITQVFGPPREEQEPEKVSEA
jgi:hypothetical protein